MNYYYGQNGWVLVVVDQLINKPIQVFTSEQKLREDLQGTVFEIREHKPTLTDQWSFEIWSNGLDALVYKVELKS